MVKTPRTRSGPKREPATIDLGPEDVRRVEDAAAPDPAEDAPAGSAEAAFAAEESLTPGERAAPPEEALREPSLLDTPPPDGPETKPPETAEAADSFRFSEPPADELRSDGPRSDGLPDPAPEAAAEAEKPAEPLAATLARPTPPPSDLAGEEGPQPGDATTPLFAEPAPEEAAPYAAAAAVPRPRTGRLVLAGFIGGVAAVLLAALLQYLGAVPSVSRDGRLDVAALRTELDGLQAQVASLRENAPAAPDASLASAVDALRADVAALKQGGSDSQGAADRLAALEQKVEGLAANAGGAVTAEQFAALGERTAAAEKQAQDGRAAIEAEAKRLDAASQRLDALEATVSGMAGKVDALSGQPQIALALAASGLKEAADRGVPFAAELATLKAIAPDLPQIAELEPYAQSGVATRAAIRDEWNAAAEAMVATENQTDPDAGLMSRLWSSATGLVSVRPIEAVEGPSVGATVARMQAAVEAGDLAKALSEYDTLPEPAKQAGAAWAEKARARAAAEKLIDAAIADAMKAA